MKYKVGQMLKYVGESDGYLFFGMVGVVEEPDRETVMHRLAFGQPYYNMNFPGYHCPGCSEHHNVDAREDVLRPIDDPDEAEDRIADNEEELIK